jgi:hypothetical protein
MVRVILSVLWYILLFRSMDGIILKKKLFSPAPISRRPMIKRKK